MLQCTQTLQMRKAHVGDVCPRQVESLESVQDLDGFEHLVSDR